MSRARLSIFIIMVLVLAAGASIVYEQLSYGTSDAVTGATFYYFYADS